MWLWERRPLPQVDKDAREWTWPPVSAAQPPTPFFQYSVRLERRSLMSERHHSHSKSPHWAAEGISEPFIQSFWRRLWDSWRTRKITYFLWMIAHQGLPLGSWLAQMGMPEDCMRSDEPTHDSLRHCLWGCDFALLVWQGTCWILKRVMPDLGYISWGTFCWLLPGTGRRAI